MRLHFEFHFKKQFDGHSTVPLLLITREKPACGSAGSAFLQRIGEPLSHFLIHKLKHNSWKCRYNEVESFACWTYVFTQYTCNLHLGLFCQGSKPSIKHLHSGPSIPIVASLPQQHLEDAKRIKLPSLQAWIKHLGRNFPRSGELEKKILDFPKEREKAIPLSYHCPHCKARGGLRTLKGDLWPHSQPRACGMGCRSLLRTPPRCQLRLGSDALWEVAEVLGGKDWPIDWVPDSHRYHSSGCTVNRAWRRYMSIDKLITFCTSLELLGRLREFIKIVVHIHSPWNNNGLCWKSWKHCSHQAFSSCKN